MGQVFGQDNIPSPVVVSTTQLTIAATNLGASTTITIGGQQYTLSSQLTCTTSGTGAGGIDTGSLAAITLYYLYAIRNASTFSVALIASATAPSTGPSMPSGYGSAYKLVGAFYSNGSSQVGATLPIAGPVNTEFMSYPAVLSATTTNPNIGTTGAVNAQWKRNGTSVEVEFGVGTGGSGMTLGSGTFYIPLPSGLTVNTGVLAPDASTFTNLGGYSGIAQGTANFQGQMVYDAAVGQICFYNGTTASLLNQAGWSTTGGSTINAKFSVPILQWAGKPTLL